MIYIKKHYMVQVYGIFDFVYLLFFIVKAVQRDEIPFYTKFLSDITSSIEAGFGFLILSVVGHIVNLSILVSFILLLKNKRAGIYLSIIQVPFKLLLIVPPTLFYLMELTSFFPSLLTVMIILVYFFEVVKLFVLMKLKNNETYPVCENK